MHQPRRFTDNVSGMVAYYCSCSTYTFPPASEIERCPSIVQIPSTVVDRVGANQVNIVGPPVEEQFRKRKVELSAQSGESSQEEQDHLLPNNATTTFNNNNNKSVRVDWSPKPRYDIDIVTKIVVYAGVGWWAMEGVPLVFSIIGLD